MSDLQQLSLFFDIEGWTPSDWISRSPIFSSFQKGKRALLRDAPLGTHFGIEIRQTGEQLDMADQDVFLWLVNFSKNSHSDKVYFSKYQILKELKKQTNKTGYKWLEESFKRLLSVSLYFKQENKKRFVACHLVDAISFDEGKDMQYVRLGHEILELYKYSSFSRISLEQRLKLKKPLAKWLQCFCVSHNKETTGYYLKTLQQTFGKENVKKNRFKDDLVLAAAELQQVGFFESFELVDKTRGMFFKYKVAV